MAASHLPSVPTRASAAGGATAERRQRRGDDPRDLGAAQPVHQRAGAEPELQRLARAPVERGGRGHPLVQRLQHRQEAAEQQPVGDRGRPRAAPAVTAASIANGRSASPAATIAAAGA